MRPDPCGVIIMRAEIIATGDELLSGGVVDTNSVFIAEGLLKIGIETSFKTVVGDDEKDMEEAIRSAIGRSDIVIITGGIGPTEDDITRKVVAKVTRRRLGLNEDALKAIKARLAGREYYNSNDRQALLPVGSRLIPNTIGTAPGFILDEEGKFIAVLPGVPREMEAMYRDGLRPILEERFGGRRFISRRVLRTFGMPESALNEAIAEFLKKGTPLIGLSADEYGVDIRIVAHGPSAANAKSIVEKTESDIRRILGDTVYGVDNQTMEEIVGALLKQRRLRLAVAESCTGGLISQRITDIPGSSEYFERAAVVYSNASKTDMIGVSSDLIESQGAVSREVAAAMADGIRISARADIGLSVTGIAGPSGGSAEKPVGLVYMAIASSSGVKVEDHRFLGARRQIRMRASQAGLDMVRRHLII